MSAIDRESIMNKGLTSSAIDRQNILNNPYALAEIEKAVRVQGIPFEGKLIVLKEPRERRALGLARCQLPGPRGNVS